MGMKKIGDGGEEEKPIPKQTLRAAFGRRSSEEDVPQQSVHLAEQQGVYTGSLDAFAELVQAFKGRVVRASL